MSQRIPPTVICPVCGQLVKEAIVMPVMLAHTDGVGKTCGFSGQPFGGMSVLHESLTR